MVERKQFYIRYFLHKLNVVLLSGPALSDWVVKLDRLDKCTDWQPDEQTGRQTDRNGI